MGLRTALAAALCALCAGPAALAQKSAIDSALANRVLDRAESIIKQHHLLTAKQQHCSSLVLRDDSDERTGKVGIYELHDKKWGGDPDVMHRLFDLEIDMKTGTAKWDNNFSDMEMRPVPRRAR
jgi:hypothetical protein